MADHVLLDEVLQVALVDLVEHGSGEREHLAGDRVHLLGGLHAGRARAHQRLVDIEVKQAHLGVGDPGHRLPVDAHELQQRDEREAGVEHRVDVAQQLDLVLGDGVGVLGAEPEPVDQPLDQRLVEPGLARGLADRHPLLIGREQLLEEAEGEPSLLGGAGDVGQRVTALAHPGHDPGGPDRGRRPLAVVLGDQPALDPAAQRRGLHADPFGGLGEGHAALAAGAAARPARISKMATGSR